MNENNVAQVTENGEESPRYFYEIFIDIFMEIFGLFKYIFYDVFRGDLA